VPRNLYRAPTDDLGLDACSTCSSFTNEALLKARSANAEPKNAVMAFDRLLRCSSLPARMSEKRTSALPLFVSWLSGPSSAPKALCASSPSPSMSIFLSVLLGTAQNTGQHRIIRGERQAACDSNDAMGDGPKKRHRGRGVARTEWPEDVEHDPKDSRNVCNDELVERLGVHEVQHLVDFLEPLHPHLALRDPRWLGKEGDKIDGR